MSNLTCIVVLATQSSLCKVKWDCRFQSRHHLGLFVLMGKKGAIHLSAWVFSTPGNPTRLSQCGYLMHFLVQRTQLKLKLCVMAKPVQQPGSAEKGRSRSFPCSFLSQLLSFPALLHWLWFLCDFFLSVFCLLTWQDEGEEFLPWTVVSSQVSEFSVNIVLHCSRPFKCHWRGWIHA